MKKLHDMLFIRRAKFLLLLTLTPLIRADDTERADDRAINVMSYNVRTASRWASTDGGDERAGRSWPLRKASVAKAIEIGRADVVGTQEGLAWQVDELAEALSAASWRRVGGGRVGDNSDEDETARAARVTSTRVAERRARRSLLYDSDRLRLLEHGTYWLSETPEAAGSRR